MEIQSIEKAFQREQFNKACKHIQERSYKEAERILCELSIKLPREINFRLKLIECYIKTLEMEKAQELLSQLQKEYPENRAVLRVAPLVKYFSNELSEAYYSTTLLSEEERSEKQINEIIKNTISHHKFERYSSIAEQDVLDLVRSGDISEHNFYRVAQPLLYSKYSLWKTSINIDLVELNNDELFIKALTYSYIHSNYLERLVTLIRKEILTVTLETMELPDNLVSLTQAMGIQSFNNEYIHYISEAELQMTEELSNLLAQIVPAEEWSTRDAEGLFLLLAMYKSLYSLPFRERLLEVSKDDWPDSLKPIVMRTLYGIQKELEWCDKVKSSSEIDSETSLKVQSQYEEHPYPRWMHLDASMRRLRYWQNLELTVYGCPHAPYKTDGPFEVLIAGCGTGMHPLNLSLAVSDNITAIDLSKRSLAYALMSANRLGINSVQFFQHDILNLEALNKKFDAIESMGVIHHMADPEVGLKSLISAVKPGGYLKLGLYSEFARESIIGLRKLYLESGMKPTDQNIRVIRKKIMDSTGTRDRNAAMNKFIDFYSMSACRDLIFHEQEHRFTLPQLKQLLDKYNLKFLGFYGLKRQVVLEFEKQFGEGKLLDLDSWAKFEEENTATFSAMYQFMTQVPG